MELREYLIEAMAHRPEPKEEVTLDAVAVLDAAMEMHAEQSARLHAAAVLGQFAETTADDLDEGETLADRLLVLLIGAVDEDSDDELDDGEQAMLGATIEAAEAYLIAQGIAAEDVSALLDSWDEEAATRVRDALCDCLPDGDEASEASMSAFAFGDSDALFDAVRRNMVSFKGGKKTIVSKRVSGPAKRMTPKQRAAFKKIQAKSHKAGANRMRAISIRKRMKSGIGMKRKFA